MSREAEPEQTKGLFRRASANGGRSLPLAGLEARLPITTTRIAGGLLQPYKGLIPASA